jgi:hypothetical protein
MAYFIFVKDLDNTLGTLSRIAENDSDLNSLNIIQSDYKIIEVSQENFNLVKFNKKNPSKYNGNDITYEDITKIINPSFPDLNGRFNTKADLNNYVEALKKSIKIFLESNKQSLVFNRWNDYYNQLNSLNLNSIAYPLYKSLEEYLNDLGQPSYSILQLP